ncbi:MAG: hypothetical protein IT536_11125 [Hyphomicrobiales bacterium]|nr:hypothetical protein [Hyphomicrobiales bacterium]
MSAEAVQSFYALLLGYACAGFLATGYQVATCRPASFRLLERGPGLATFAAIPFLVFAAPFIIMRNCLRSRCHDGRRRFESVMAATVAAGVWSLMTGTVVAMAVAALNG